MLLNQWLKSLKSVCQANGSGAKKASRTSRFGRTRALKAILTGAKAEQRADSVSPSSAGMSQEGHAAGNTSAVANSDAALADSTARVRSSRSLRDMTGVRFGDAGRGNSRRRATWSRSNQAAEVLETRALLTNLLELGTDDFRISDIGPNGNTNHDAAAPDVAFNAVRNEYLVVFDGDDTNGESEIFGQFITTLGAETGSNDFQISDQGPAGNSSFDAVDPKVVWNSTDNEFLVVWRGDTATAGEDEIFGQRLNANGSSLGSVFQISQAGTAGDTAQDAVDPDVVYNATDNEYLVVWSSDHQQDDELEIYGQRISAAGAAVGTNDFRISNQGADGDTSVQALEPAIAWDSNQNEYLVTWTTQNASGFSVHGQLLLNDGSEDGSDFSISDQDEAESSDVAFTAASNRYYVVYEAERAPGEDEIYGRTVSTSGSPGTERQISSHDPDGVTIDANDPSIVWGAADNQFWVAWHGDTATADEDEIFIQDISAFGSVSISNQRISHVGPDGNANFQARFAGLAYNSQLNEYLTAFVADNNTGGQVNDENEIYVQRLGEIDPETIPLVVSSTGDGVDGNFSQGNFTLREAIELANLRPGADTITFSSGGSIDFDDGEAETITLTNGQLVISSDITIEGTGASLLTVSGNDASRVFDITSGDHDVTFDSLTIADGFAVGGAGIRNSSSGFVSLFDVVLINNDAGTGQGGGILHQGGSLSMTGGRLVENDSRGGSGSSIVGGTAMFDRVTIADNVLIGANAPNFLGIGGAGIRIESGAAATVLNSTISNNQMTQIAAGAGILNLGTLIVVNSTISGNFGGSYGGGIVTDGTLNVVNSTITGNTGPDAGGIATMGATSIVNSIVVGNTVDGSTPGDIFGTINTTNSASNIIGDASSAGGLTDGTNNNHVGVNVATVLDTNLTDNGGFTHTHALVPGSPAIDAGDNTLATDDGTVGGTAIIRDQRSPGFARIFGGTVDIGAFELQPGTPLGDDVRLGEGGTNNHDPYFADGVDAATLNNGNVVVAFAYRTNSGASPSSPDGDRYGAFYQIYRPDGTAVFAAPQIPYLDQNPVGVGSQRNIRVAALTGGGFALTWNSIDGNGDTYFPSDFSGGDTWTRVFNENGAAVSSTHHVNANDPSGVADGQYPVAIVGLTDGGFAIAWGDENDNSGNKDDYFVRAYNANGTPKAAGNIQLGSNAVHGDKFQDFSSLVPLSNGGFAASWRTRDANNDGTGASADGDGAGAFVQVFKADGTAQGPAFFPYEDINSNGVGSQSVRGSFFSQTFPSLAPLSGGGFAVTWQSTGATGPNVTIDDVGNGSNSTSGGDTYVRTYNNTGVATSGTSRVNQGQPLSDEQAPVGILGLTGGGFVVYWQDSEDDTGNNTDDLFVRTYNAAGVAQGASVQLGAAAVHEGLFQDSGDLIALDDGGFVASWRTRDENNNNTGAGADGEGFGAFFQVFNANGTARTSEMIPYNDINPTGQGSQNSLKLAAVPGGFVTTWNSVHGPTDVGGSGGGNQTSGGDTYTRYYANDGTPKAGSIQVHVGEPTGAIDQQDPNLIVPSDGSYFVVFNDENNATNNKDDYFIRGFQLEVPVAPDTTAPGLLSFERQTPSDELTNADSLTFLATFSEDVQNVNAADFGKTGTNAPVSVNQVTPSTYEITLSGGNLANRNNVVQINLQNSHNIQDLAGNDLPDGEPATDESYTLDNTTPVLLSFERQTPSDELTNADTLTFLATFNEDVQNVNAADFTRTGTNANLAVNQVTPSTYEITLSGGNLANRNNVVQINLQNSHNIQDLAGNDLPDGEPSTDEGYTVDNTAPVLLSFERQTPTGEITNANTLVFLATFNEDVQNVNAADFARTGTTANLAVNQVTPSTYEITLSGGNLANRNNVVQINLQNSHNIQDLAGNDLPDGEPSTDESYTADNTAPTLTAFARSNPTAQTTDADTLVFDIIFSENVGGVDETDFEVTGLSGVTTTLNGSGSSYQFVISGGNLSNANSTVQLNLASGQNIVDEAGNPLPNAEPGTDETYIVQNDVTAPTVAITRDDSNPTNAGSVVFNVDFSEDVTGVNPADFELATTNSATGNSNVVVGNAGDSDDSTYTVTVTSVMGDGTLGLDFAVATDIADLVGNDVDQSPTADEVYTVDNTAPTLAITRNGGEFATGSVTFNLDFSEDVTGVDVGDFNAVRVGVFLAGFEFGDAGDSDDSTYTLTFTDLTEEGTLELEVVSSTDITDLAGNALNPTLTAAEIFTVSDTPFLVSNTNDDGFGSLRYAVKFANDIVGADTIVFSDGNESTHDFTDATADTIVLDGQIRIEDAITIVGAGPQLLTLDADGRSRVFNIRPGNHDVTLERLRIINGNTTQDGGGVINQSSGTVEFDHVSFLDNVAAQGGGGISNTGSGILTVRNSTFSGNNATGGAGGGAILTGVGNLAVANSTLSGNTTSGSSGGGGILQLSGSVTVINSTIALNAATHASATGGGIRRFFGNVAVNNSIVSGNTSPGADAVDNIDGSFTGNNNLIDVDVATIIDTTLQNNGGFTNTHALVAGSPAIDAGDNTTANNAALTTDQRGTGFARIIGGTVDIGAFEAAVTPETEVTLVGGVLTITDINGGDSNDDLTISYASGNYTITDNGGLILTTVIAGATGDGTDTLVIPDTGVTGIDFETLGGDDDVTVDGVQASLSDGFTITGGTGADTATVNAAIAITGTGAVDITVTDLLAGNGSVIGGPTATGDITITADSVQLQGSTNVQSAGALTIQPRTATTTIGLGGGTGDLNLDDTELGLLADGFSSVTIGDATSGDIDIDTATFNDALNLVTGGEIHDGAGEDLNMASGDTVTAAGTVAPGQSPGILNVAGDFAFADNSTYEVEINNVSPGTTLDQIDATGAVSIGSGVALDLVGLAGFLGTRAGGESFEIINRTGGTGTFDGLPEGATISNFFSGNDGAGTAPLDATITYEGGDGDDVVLTVIHPEADISVTVDDGQTTASPGDAVTYTIFVTNDGPYFGSNLSILSTLPASLTGVSVTSITPNGGTSGVADNSSGNDLDVEVAVLPVDGTLTIVVTGTIDPSATGSLDVTVNVPYSNDPVAGNNTATDTNTLAALSTHVINTADDGAGSLRQAIANAELNPGPDTITFDDGTLGTDFHDATPDVITLGGTQLAISSDITISGPGADLLTVSGDNASRVFDIAGGNHDVTLDSLTIADGSSGIDIGGGIRNQSTGTVTITDAVVSDSRSLLSGGGISHGNGTLTIERTSVSQNTARSGPGGGILILGGTVSIVNSTIAGNTAPDAFAGNGGGIRVSGGTLTVFGSTISGNSSGINGGGISSVRPLTIINSTISGNMTGSAGGGVISSSSLVVSNSTITGNSANGGGGIRQVSGTVTINNSIVSGNTATDVSGSYTATNSLIGGTVTDILDTTLADNGGPTLTHALIAGSPAIDAGDNTLATDDGTATGTALTTDQRGTGFARILGGTVDIGAFEANVILVTNDNDDDDGSADPGAGSADGTSLREAINAANTAAGPAIIEFSDTTAGGAVNFHDATPDVITLGGTQLAISSDITISGPGADLLTISGNNASGVIEVQAGGNFTLQAATVTGSNDTGLLIGPDAIGSITASTITGNAGSGVSVDSLFTGGAGQLTVSSSTISNNGGDGISTSGNLTVTNSTVSGNTAEGLQVAGGFDLGTLVLTNSTIADNGSFGIIAGGPTQISNTIIVGNSTGAGGAEDSGADVSGGGITSNGFNVIGNAGDGAAFGANDTTGVFLTNVLNTTLADNGGPTLTHALVAGSPAIDAGDNTLATETGLAGGTALTTDQRGTGFARIIGGTVDIGAFEFDPPATVPVNLSVDSTTGTEADETVITVTATADAAVSGAQTVTVAVTGTGITAGDYTLSDTTITIPDGMTTGSVTFTVADDGDVEALVETATLEISNPSAGIFLGATTTQDITITDDDHIADHLGLLTAGGRTAGNIIATLIGNDLDLTADTNDNGVQVFENAAGDIVVSGLGGSTVNGVPEVTFSAAAGSIPGRLRVFGNTGTLLTAGIGLDVANSLALYNGTGDNAVELTDVTVGSSFRWDGSSGTSHLAADNLDVTARADWDATGAATIDVTGSQFGTNLLLDTGTANDIIRFTDTQVDVHQSINTGSGTDSVTLDETTTLGNLNVVSTTGSAATTLTDVQVDGTTFISAGDDADTLDISAGTFGRFLHYAGDGNNNVTATGNTVFSDSVFIAAQADDDTINLTGSTLASTLTINTGDGMNDLTLEQTSIGGKSVIVSKADMDELTFTDVGFGTSTFMMTGSGNDNLNLLRTTFDGLLAIHTEADDDTVISDTMNVAGTMAARLGAGTDSITVSNGTFQRSVNVDATSDDNTLNLTTSTFSQNLNVNFSNGPTGSNVTFDDVQVTGSSVLSSGIGRDTFNLTNGSVFGGSFLLNTGNSNDTITASDTTFDGSLVVSSGEGQDVISLTDVSANSSLTLNSGLRADTLELLRTDIVGKTNIVTDSGNDILELTDVGFGTTTFVNTGSQNDAVTLLRTTFDGPGNISTAGGDDSVTADTVGTTASLTIDLGAHDDTFDWDNLTSTGSLIVQPGLGDDAVRLLNSNISVGSTAFVPLGGNNVVDLQDNVFATHVTVATNNGAIALRVKNNAFQSTSSLFGGNGLSDVFMDNRTNTFGAPPTISRFDDLTNNLIDELFEDMLGLAFP